MAQELFLGPHTTRKTVQCWEEKSGAQTALLGSPLPPRTAPESLDITSVEQADIGSAHIR